MSELREALRVAKETVDGWTVDSDGRVHVHKDVISKAINAAWLAVQDPVGCECDEFPQCTHVLYFYMGVRHAKTLNPSLRQPLTPRCQERHPESGQCELRLGHDKIHLAGDYCWPVTTAEEKR
jgi:hypothetical protein